MKDLNQLYNELTNARTSIWFSEFLKATNEKKIISKFFDSLTTKLVLKNSLSDTRILDIGSGDGELALSITNHLGKMGKTIRYQAIDNDQNFNDNNRRQLENNNQLEEVTIITGDCFSSDLNKLDNDADIIIASNIAYYTEDMPKFTASLASKMAPNGLAIYMHQAANSEVNILRDKYAVKLHTNAVNAIRDSLLQDEQLCFGVDINSNINLPSNIDQLIYHLQNHGTKNIPNSHTNAKMLLEFIVQTPLEVLEQSGKLNDYLSDLQELLELHPGRLILTSQFQITPNIHAKLEFIHEVLPDIVKELAQEFSINDKNVRIIQANDLSMEKSELSNYIQ